jgi:hypothetical protein
MESKAALWRRGDRWKDSRNRLWLKSIPKGWHDLIASFCDTPPGLIAYLVTKL